MMNQKENVELENNNNENEKKKCFSFKQISEFIKKVPYKTMIILVIVLLIVILVPRRLPSIFKNSNYSKIDKICNLATIEAYYHNVAAEKKEASTIGKILGNIGYKEYWIEYDAVIEYGIDAKKVVIKKPNLKNEVKVYIPPAEVLGEPKLIKEFIQDPITDTGFLTSLSNEDKNMAIENSIKKLKESAKRDSDNLLLARERAKKFFEQYIINVGKEIGVEYKVIFED